MFRTFEEVLMMVLLLSRFCGEYIIGWAFSQSPVANTAVILACLILKESVN